MAQQTLVVIGGGAAGFFCAVNAARMRPELRVILLEKTGKLLSKVKVSGGGRCNVTHGCFDIRELSRHYPRGEHFVRKAFYRFSPADTINWFGERGVKLKTEQDGRIFPVTDSSQTVIDCLLREAERYSVEVRLHSNVSHIEKKAGGFLLKLQDASSLYCDRVCIACGGMNRLEQFNWIAATGHTIVEPVPSLFTFNLPRHPILKLMGVSVPLVSARVKGSRLQQQGPLLITHWGLSGPAILKLSAWGARALAAVKWHFTAVVNWIPEWEEKRCSEKLAALQFEWASQKMETRNPFQLPARLWSFLLEQAKVAPGKRWADLAAGERNLLARSLTAMEFPVQGKTSFREEFVTAGGVALAEVDPQTMQSRKCPGIWFAGEVLDVDGVTGGFNFQHAWTSGYLAALSAASPEPGQEGLLGS